MDYIYDIVLNFQTEYYDFYEWNKSDKMINVKKIPIYKVNNKDYLNIKNNSVIINNKELLNKNKMFLITNGFEVMGIFINKEGKVIKRSSLLFEEADDILEDHESFKYITLEYKKNTPVKTDIKSRSSKEKEKYLNTYFSIINKDKDRYLLKYIYYDIYQKEESNINTIYSNLLALKNNNIAKLYNSVKKVNAELKKDKQF